MTARTPPVPPRYLGAAALALLVLLGAWYWLGSKPPPAKAPPAIPVDIAERTRADVPVYLEGLGTVQAFYTVTVTARVDGQIDKVAFTEGQDVKKGTLLVQIDPRPYQAALESCDRHPRQGRGAAGQRAARHGALQAARPRGPRQQADRRHAARTHRAARRAGEGRRGAPSTTRAPSSITPPSPRRSTGAPASA